MFAIIKTGGKQYLFSPGDKIRVEALKGDKGKEVVFDDVLLVEKNKKLEIGAPFVSGAKVIGKVLSQGKGKKVVISKYKRKTRYRKKQGHRQPYTEVEIVKIEL